MSSTRLAEVVQTAAARMRADFEGTKAYKHRPEAGKSREGILCEFIEPRVPGHIKTAHSAEIAAASGYVSGQCDVVLYDRSTPPILDTGTYRIIPNECVYGVIEVKSSLDKGQLISACEDICRVKEMPKTAYFRPVMYSPFLAHGKEYNHLPTLGLIFAFDGSDISTLADHFRDWCEGRAPWERPDGVYILGRGSLLWTKPGTVDGFDFYPSPGSGIAVVQPSTQGDVLFNLMLHLNAVLTQANMWSLRLMDYAASSSADVIDRVLIVDRSDEVSPA